MDCSSKELKAYRDLLLEKGIAVSLGESKIAAEICRWVVPEFDEATANLFVAGRFSSGAEELLILPPDRDVLMAVKRGLLKAKYPTRRGPTRTLKSGEKVSDTESDARIVGRGAGFAIERAIKRMRRTEIAKDPESGKPKGGDPKVGDVLTIITGKSRHKLVYKVVKVERNKVAFNRLEVIFDFRSPEGGGNFYMEGREAEKFLSIFRDHGYEPGSNCTVDIAKASAAVAAQPKEGPKDPGLPKQVYDDLRKLLMMFDGVEEKWGKARDRGLTDLELEVFLDTILGEYSSFDGATIRGRNSIERTSGRNTYKPVTGKKFMDAVRWVMEIPRLVGPLKGVGSGIQVVWVS